MVQQDSMLANYLEGSIQNKHKYILSISTISYFSSNNFITMDWLQNTTKIYTYTKMHFIFRIECYIDKWDMTTTSFELFI